MKRLPFNRFLLLSLMLCICSSALASKVAGNVVIDAGSSANQEYVSNIYPTLDAITNLIKDPGDDPVAAKEKLDSIMLSIEQPLEKASHLSRISSKGDEKIKKWFEQQFQAWQQVGSIADRVVDYQVSLIIRIDILNNKLIPALELKKKRYIEVWEGIWESLHRLQGAINADDYTYRRAMMNYESMLFGGEVLQITLLETSAELTEDNKVAYEPLMYEKIKILTLILSPNIPGEPELEKRVISWKVPVEEKFLELELAQDAYDQSAKPVYEGTLFSDRNLYGISKYEEMHKAMKASLDEAKKSRGKYLRSAP